MLLALTTLVLQRMMQHLGRGAFRNGFINVSEAVCETAKTVNVHAGRALLSIKLGLTLPHTFRTRLRRAATMLV